MSSRNLDALAPLRFGVEHEMQLWSGDDQVDFRHLIGEVAGNINPLDPGDPRARRLPSGVALTADGWEAELATPPFFVSQDALWEADNLLRHERTELRDAAARHGVDRITGYSTHLSVSVPDDRAVGIARMFARRCGTTVAAITEPAGSSGVFVRPRRGRLEFGCEFVEGPRLVAALVVLTGCVRGLVAGSDPPRLGDSPLTPSREKFGWFIDPAHLGGGCSEVRSWARAWALREGVSVPGAYAKQMPPRPATVAICSFQPARHPLPPAGVHPRSLGEGVTARTEWLTWAHVVWLFEHPSGISCRAVMAADDENAFVAALDAGEHDRALRRMLRRPLRRRQLLINADLGRHLFWHDVRPGALVPSERQADGSTPLVPRMAARRDLQTTVHQEAVRAKAARRSWRRSPGTVSLPDPGLAPK